MSLNRYLIVVLALPRRFFVYHLLSIIRSRSRSGFWFCYLFLMASRMLHNLKMTSFCHVAGMCGRWSAALTCSSITHWKLTPKNSDQPDFYFSFYRLWLPGSSFLICGNLGRSMLLDFDLPFGHAGSTDRIWEPPVSLRLLSTSSMLNWPLFLRLDITVCHPVECPCCDSYSSFFTFVLQ